MIRTELEYQAAVQRLLELDPTSLEFTVLDREVSLFEQRLFKRPVKFDLSDVLKISKKEK